MSDTEFVVTDAHKKYLSTILEGTCLLYTSDAADE